MDTTQADHSRKSPHSRPTVDSPQDSVGLSHIQAELEQLNLERDTLALDGLKAEVERLKASNLLQLDEISSLKSESRSYLSELESLNRQVEDMKVKAENNLPATVIGREVRLRFLEQHRLRMGRKIGNQGYDRIKCGDRAAHRGRPLVDALLCLAGSVDDEGVYLDLYGIRPETVKKLKDVSEIMDVIGFRASLQSEGRTTPQFRNLFGRFHEAIRAYSNPMELKKAFGENRVLQELHAALQDCYDKIVAANPRHSSN